MNCCDEYGECTQGPGCPARETYVAAPVVRKATPDEQWLEAQLDRISPDRHEIGSVGECEALAKLAIELRIALITANANMDYLRSLLRPDGTK